VALVKGLQNGRIVRGIPRLIDDLSQRYPLTTGNFSIDFETIEQHHKAIKEEITRAKPRERILMPLMKSTFPVRSCFIKHKAESVKQMLTT